VSLILLPLFIIIKLTFTYLLHGSFQCGVSAAPYLSTYEKEEFEVGTIGSWERDYQFGVYKNKFLGVCAIYLWYYSPYSFVRADDCSDVSEPIRLDVHVIW